MLSPNPLSPSAALPGHRGMWVWSRSETVLGPVGATLGVRDEREVWAPSLLIPIKIIAPSPDAWPIVSGFIPLISDLGMFELHAVGPILGGVLTLVWVSWTVCAERVDWDAASLEIQETLESGMGDASSRLGGLASWVELSMMQSRAVIPLAIALFLAELQTALLIFAREIPTQFCWEAAQIMKTFIK